MAVFDFDAWAEATKKIPREYIAAALNAVVDRKKAIDLEPQVFAQRNEAAKIYHSAAPHEEHDGVIVWVDPIADFAAYPTGFEVTHLGKRWANISQDVATGEPGVDEAWQEIEPEEVPSE
ncbi:hypothetical protein YH66_09560 [[Brevibacterium] flavum]|uniref:Uncharacterized protein n=1 Tax=[Brevibacterium] flavum TaxID=92706 RepID=A0A0F6WQZ6_9CORY|nr:MULTISPECIES: hypothetical protein [Corynebacterium]AKF27780.1 hypothetical protein YH66_09560 [[Brevibacterium] flavum]ANE08607.1 hypothetical protein A3654_09615 [Corynebacterium glutamicum]AST21021.1 hypothetical protein CEY17_09700 [Corynebacterium glutamicum ATCC 14067]KIH73278.1 hypothetical protein SD36_09585 [Corynebacterium glutamicum]OKX96004.1 hypothetical protein AUP71_01575 [Corynebacterium glutamicum]